MPVFTLVLPYCLSQDKEANVPLYDFSMSFIFISSDIIYIFFPNMITITDVKLILSYIHFRHNSSCFCFISINKNSSKQIRSRTVLCLWATHNGSFVTESFSRLNESVERMTQWLTHAVICRHLLAILILYIKYIFPSFPKSISNISIQCLVLIHQNINYA